MYSRAFISGIWYLQNRKHKSNELSAARTGVGGVSTNPLTCSHEIWISHKRRHGCAIYQRSHPFSLVPEPFSDAALFHGQRHFKDRDGRTSSVFHRLIGRLRIQLLALAFQ